MADMPHDPADERSGLGPDPRDETLARELAVQPLDEVTRRRLVARALDETVVVSSPTRAGRSRLPFVAAAAAVVVVLVIGLGVLASTRDDVRSEDQALQPAPRTTSKREATGLAPSVNSNAATLAPSSGGNAPAVASADDSGALARSIPPDLGDFGDLSTASARRRLRAAIAAAPSDQPTAFSASAPVPDACDVAFPNVVATATGTVGDRPARVVVTRRANGSLRVRAVLAETCEVRGLPSS